MQANKKFVLAALLTVSGAVSAEIATVGDLRTIQAETVMLEAKVKRAEAAKKLAESTGSPASSATGSLPVIRTIISRNGRAVVTLLFAGNVRVDAMQGDVLPGDFRLSRVDLATGKVTLSDTSGKAYVIGSSAAAPTLKETPSNTGPQYPLLPGPAPVGGRK